MIQVMVDTVHSVQSKMKKQVLKSNPSSQNPREPKMTDETRERQLHPTEVDPFTNEIELTTKDWICLILGTVLIAPFRAIGVILGLFFAWFVAKIGKMKGKINHISNSAKIRLSLLRYFWEKLVKSSYLMANIQ